MNKAKRRNKNGHISLDDILLEGGIVVNVSLDKESGVFTAIYNEVFKGENTEHHDNESWRGKDLEKIRDDVKAWAKEKKSLKWEPVIAVGPKDDFGMDRNKEVFDQSFIRLLRAKKFSGDGYEWRSWAYSKPEGGFVYDEDLDVYPPAGKASEPKPWGNRISPVILPYTPDRWLALLKLVEMEKALKDRLHQLVEGGQEKLTEFLQNVPKMGLLGLSKEQKSHR